jgi:hypothetical protein
MVTFNIIKCNSRQPQEYLQLNLHGLNIAEGESSTEISLKYMSDAHQKTSKLEIFYQGVTLGNPMAVCVIASHRVAMQMVNKHPPIGSPAKKNSLNETSATCPQEDY